MRLAMLAAVLVLAPLAPARAAAEEWHQEFPLTGRADLHVITNDGNVVVSTWNRKAVAVRINTARWGSGKTRVEHDQHGDRVDIRVMRPEGWFHLGIGPHPTEIEILLPRDADLDVTTSSGRIVATHLDGRLKAHTRIGRIRIDGRFDQLDLGTRVGSIKAVASAGSNVREGWLLESAHGRVDLKVPDDLDAVIDAEARFGHVRSDLPLRDSGSTSRHWIRGDMNGGGRALRIRTGEGSIRIHSS